MNRTYYYNYIEEKLGTLAYRINSRDKLNTLELNIHSETFFADLCNIIFDYKLINMNTIKQNVEGIDLIDNDNKIIVQVSATCTKQKIEDSLEKSIYSTYVGYKYKFISISRDAEKLRDITFNNPHNILFDPKEDIIDNAMILRNIISQSIDKQNAIFEFIKKELGSDIDIIKVDSNLAEIINILSDENLTVDIDSPEINAFAIQNKIEFNNLKNVQGTIDDYKIFYHKLDEKYSEFDKEGSNRSFSIFQAIRKQYFMLEKQSATPEELFYGIINNIINIIEKSHNYILIPFEELEVCVNILVVDTFIRCKIFKNPEGYSHVITR
jgi:hypothetical protein